eukprot:3555626-Prymnesium_polylepis.1
MRRREAFWRLCAARTVASAGTINLSGFLPCMWDHLRLYLENARKTGAMPMVRMWNATRHSTHGRERQAVLKRMTFQLVYVLRLQSLVRVRC